MKKKLLTTIAAGAIALCASPVFAQSLDNDQETFKDQVNNPDTNMAPLTAEDVSPENPWGELVVDMDADIEPGQYDDMQLAELKQRCEFIMQHPETYGPKPASFCEGKVQGLTQ